MTMLLENLKQSLFLALWFNHKSLASFFIWCFCTQVLSLRCITGSSCDCHVVHQMSSAFQERVCQLHNKGMYFSMSIYQFMPQIVSEVILKVITLSFLKYRMYDVLGLGATFFYITSNHFWYHWQFHKLIRLDKKNVEMLTQNCDNKWK